MSLVLPDGHRHRDRGYLLKAAGPGGRGWEARLRCPLLPLWALGTSGLRKELARGDQTKPSWGQQGSAVRPHGPAVRAVPGQRQAAGLRGVSPFGGRSGLGGEMFVPLLPHPAMTSGPSADMTAAGGGSLAPVHVSTLDLLGVHWPEIMPPMEVGGRNIGGRFAFFPFLFNTLNMHYWISTQFL